MNISPVGYIPNMRAMQRMTQTESIQPIPATVPVVERSIPSELIEASSSRKGITSLFEGQRADGSISSTRNISSSPLTGLEDTTGNFASNYVEPSELVLAEYADATHAYENDKFTFQSLLIPAHLQSLTQGSSGTIFIRA